MEININLFYLIFNIGMKFYKNCELITIRREVLKFLLFFSKIFEHFNEKPVTEL